VKTRFSFWTSDGGACGRRDLLGASSLETPFGDLAGLLLMVYFGRW